MMAANILIVLFQSIISISQDRPWLDSSRNSWDPKRSLFDYLGETHSASDKALNRILCIRTLHFTIRAHQSTRWLEKGPIDIRSSLSPLFHRYMSVLA